MEMEIKNVNNRVIAVLTATQPLIYDVASALDLIATVAYETGANRIALPKAALAEDFFVLSTGLAGEILQKFVNYQTKIAIFGDFSSYTSKPLKDFIYESNRGQSVFFVADAAAAVERLSLV